MNKTKIEWCDSSWNPVTGCWHGCEYCYAKRIAERFSGYIPDENPDTIRVIRRPFDSSMFEVNSMQARRQKDGKTVPAIYPFRFEPTFHRYRLDEPERWTKPRNIFVCSMADLFGDWVPDEWISEVFAACKRAPQHRYFFLTKNPKRYVALEYEGLLPKSNNMWFGTTITDDSKPFFYSDERNTFLSIEPLLGEFAHQTGDVLCGDIDWVIIGAETGNRKNKVVPRKEWIDNISEACQRDNIPLFMKDSLIPIVGEENMRREFPWQIKEADSEK